MLSYTEFRDAVEANLRDPSNTYFSTAELDYDIAQALRDVAKFIKHLVRVTDEAEIRTGVASSTSANNLVDATNAQFLAGDVGKRVHNTTDNTWADIISYSSTSQVGLSHDIMASGESYKLYNKGCSANNQLNIEDVKDHLWIEKVEFPIGKPRNFSCNGTILTIEIDFDPVDTAKLGYIWFAKRHKLSQLTAMTGVVDLTEGYSKGDKSMVIDALTDDDIIEEGQEFTLADRPQIYTVTANVTVASNEATVSFYPGLDADVANDIAVTFVESTLQQKDETLAIEYVVGLALMNEANRHLASISPGGTGTYKRYLEISAFRYNEALKKLRALARPATAEVLPMSNYGVTI